MVRQQADASFAALSRRRPDLTSPHFGVVTSGHEPAPSEPRLGFAVPKRHLPRAVDRNAVKRVAREAWRLASWGNTSRPAIAMIKLRAIEPHWKQLPGRTLKKLWRAELDELIARWQRRAASPRAGSASRPVGGTRP